MRLDLVAATWDAIDDALDTSAGEVTPEIQAMLDAVGLDEKEGVDSAILSIRAHEGDVLKFKKIEDEFALKRKRAEARVEQRKAWVRGYMHSRNLTKLPGDYWKGFQLCKSGKPPVEILVPPEELPSFWRVVEYRADKEAIREWLEKVAPVEPEHPDGRRYDSMARLGEPTQSLRIY